ncbi:unnamed protein product [Adineta ricciae]|uniref:Uncharacterized protein n=1 Tax=Adineta ricciae TaxID=249248 RepID=A0A816FQ44_ADIRI|nr:unnamed protein product [Adineta ricciae]
MDDDQSINKTDDYGVVRMDNVLDDNGPGYDLMHVNDGDNGRGGNLPKIDRDHHEVDVDNNYDGFDDDENSAEDILRQITDMNTEVRICTDVIKYPGRTIPYLDSIGSNIEFYQILQEFDGSNEILVHRLQEKQQSISSGIKTKEKQLKPISNKQDNQAKEIQKEVDDLKARDSSLDVNLKFWKQEIEMKKKSLLEKKENLLNQII